MVKSFGYAALAEGDNSELYGPIPEYLDLKIETIENLTKKSKIECRSGEILNVHISPE